MEYLPIFGVVLSLVILLILLAPYFRYLHGRSAGPRIKQPLLVPPAPEGLPEGHWWPQKYDEFDGVWERWVCRTHGESHLRKRL